MCSNHSNSKGHNYTLQLLAQASNNGIFGMRFEQPSSPEDNIMLQKYRATTLYEFLDIYPLPTNLKEVKEKKKWKNISLFGFT